MNVHLQTLNTIATSQDSPEASFAALLAAVAATNDTLQSAADSTNLQPASNAQNGLTFYAMTARGDKILDKLQEWIKKAFDVLVQIARNLISHGKISVSVGVVGVVLTVDVTVEVSGATS